jgi:hypothetical protein
LKCAELYEHEHIFFFLECIHNEAHKCVLKIIIQKHFIGTNEFAQRYRTNRKIWSTTIYCIARSINFVWLEHRYTLIIVDRINFQLPEPSDKRNYWNTKLEVPQYMYKTPNKLQAHSLTTILPSHSHTHTQLLHIIPITWLSHSATFWKNMDWTIWSPEWVKNKAQTYFHNSHIFGPKQNYFSWTD